MTMRDLSEIGEVGACLLGDPRRLGRPHASQEFQGIHAANSSTTLPECNSALLAHDGSNLRCNAGMENRPSDGRTLQD